MIFLINFNMPIVDIEKERQIVIKGREQGKSDDFIKAAVLRFRERSQGAESQDLKQAALQGFEASPFFGKTSRDVMIGGAKGFLKGTGSTLSSIGEKGIRGLGRFLTPKKYEAAFGFAADRPTAAETLKARGTFDYSNKTQEYAGLAENIGEYLIPSAGVVKAGKVFGTGIKGLLGRSAIEAATAGGITALQ